MVTNTIPRTIDSRWNLERVIGEGVGSICFLAEHTRIERRGIVRVIRPEYAAPAVLAAFNDATLLHAKCLVPELIRTEDVGNVELGKGPPIPYMVTDIAQGVSLSDWRKTVRSLHEKRAALIALVDSIARLHAAGAIHGDLKPSSIVLGDDRNQPVVLLLCGWLPPQVLKSVLSHASLEKATQYWPPELKQRSVRSAAGDVYSLAWIVLDQLIGYDMSSSLRARYPYGISEPVKVLGELKRALLDDELAKILGIALLEQPEARPDAGFLASALESMSV